MDINGARVLARRVGPTASAGRESVASQTVSEQAPPVFHWFGIDRPGVETPDPLSSAAGRRPGPRGFSLRRG